MLAAWHACCDFHLTTQSMQITAIQLSALIAWSALFSTTNYRLQRQVRKQLPQSCYLKFTCTLYIAYGLASTKSFMTMSHAFTKPTPNCLHIARTHIFYYWTANRPMLEPTTCRSQIQCHNEWETKTTYWYSKLATARPHPSLSARKNNNMRQYS